MCKEQKSTQQNHCTIFFLCVRKIQEGNKKMKNILVSFLVIFFSIKINAMNNFQFLNEQKMLEEIKPITRYYPLRCSGFFEVDFDNEKMKMSKNIFYNNSQINSELELIENYLTTENFRDEKNSERFNICDMNSDDIKNNAVYLTHSAKIKSSILRDISVQYREVNSKSFKISGPYKSWINNSLLFMSKSMNMAICVYDSPIISIESSGLFPMLISLDNLRYDGLKISGKFQMIGTGFVKILSYRM